MGSATPEQSLRITIALARRLAFNLKTVYLFVCNDIIIIVIWAAMGTICSQRSTYYPAVVSISAAPNTPSSDIGYIAYHRFLSFLDVPWANMLKGFSLSAVWVFMVSLGFSISNQRQPVSVQEDTLNKPWRPLPSHRITFLQASKLLSITTTIGLLFSSVFGGLGPYLIQLAASYYYNDLGGAQGHHFIRDLLNGIGMTAWLFGCIDIAGGPGFHFSISNVANSVVLIAAITCTIAIQDFRDLDGDLQCGRATFPIVFGHGIARVILAASILVWSFGIGFALKLRLLSGLSGLGILIAVRLLLLRNRSADKVTMELWFGWFATVSLLLL
jgi:hypothetical protein